MAVSLLTHIFVILIYTKWQISYNMYFYNKPLQSIHIDIILLVNLKLEFL